MKPRQIQQLLADAVAHHRAGLLTEASQGYELILVNQPCHFDALHLSGVIALQQGRAAEAEDRLARAHAVVPSERMCAMRLALAISALGRQSEAEGHLRRVLQNNPRFHEAWDNLGFVLQMQGQFAEAVACHRRAVAVEPAYAPGWCNLGLALLFAENAAEALACQDRALAAEPGFARALHGRAMALQHLHRIPEALEAYDAAIVREPMNFETRSYRLMALHYREGISPEALFQEHRTFGDCVNRSIPPRSPGQAGRPVVRDRRLRVAFLSPDFRAHSVAYFIEPLLKLLDRQEFEVVIYHDHFQTDAISARFQSLAALWRNFAGQSADRVAEQIRADAPDILVDLAGHSGLNRLPLFARRLAPVQVSYLGYPDTTGLDAMDFRLVDPITDPVGVGDACCVERLVRFAPAAWAYQPPADAPAPLAPGLRPFTFGSCNNLAKLTDEVLGVWARILAAVPGAHLALKAAGLEQPSVQAWLRGRMQAAGIDSDRIRAVGRTVGTADHLAFYQGIDAALDTYPYHGTTTTCEALWMGVPVVTRVGDRHAARVGQSLLTAVGEPQWAARDWAGYVEIAAGLGRAGPRGLAARMALRQQLADSVLMDHAGQAARFGNALRECWQMGVRNSEGGPDAGRAVA